MQTMPREKKSLMFAEGDWYSLVLPGTLAVLLFVVTLFALMIPHFEQLMMERKREMVRELVHSAWSIAHDFHSLTEKGEMKPEEAKKLTAEILREMRYGPERKDYFWVSNLEPRLIVHPYRPDLEGQVMSDYADPDGKKLFVESARIAEEQHEGWLDYRWQWKDESDRVVPKLSFVKGFEPWGWVIGTGIYLEDVRGEISAMTQKVFATSFSIAVAIALLLTYQVKKALSVSRARTDAEERLRESRERYRALADATTEGMYMTLDGAGVYFNRHLPKMLGYTVDSFPSLDFSKLLPEDAPERETLIRSLSGCDETNRFETLLLRGDNSAAPYMLQVSPVEREGKRGAILTIRDLSLVQEQGMRFSAEEMGFHVIRFTLSSKPRIMAMDNALAEKIQKENQSPVGRELSEYLVGGASLFTMMRQLEEKGYVSSLPVRFRSATGTLVCSLSGTLIDEESGKVCEAIIEDITDRVEGEQHRASLISSMTSDRAVMLLPADMLCEPGIKVDVGDTAEEALGILKEQQQSALLVEAKGVVIGILTAGDLTRRYLAGYAGMQTVGELMTAPVVFMPPDSLVYEAVLSMRRHSLGQVVVRKSSGEVAGVLSLEAVAASMGDLPSILLRRISKAKNTEELVQCHGDLKAVLKSFRDLEINSGVISRMISVTGDEIIRRCAELIESEIGKAPVEYALLCLGSQGRYEQGLLTDQDNALIYAEDESKENTAKNYFSNFGNRLCAMLKKIGYKECPGGVMVMNEEWRLSIEGWKQRVNHWVREGTPRDLRETGIFFDFRLTLGSERLEKELRDHVFKVTEGHSAFFTNMATGVLEDKPPLTLFGSLKTDSIDDIQGIDLKAAIRPLVDLIRIYALKNKVAESGTVARLHALREKQVFSARDCRQMEKVFLSLNHYRLSAQAEHAPPDNILHPDELSELELSVVKRCFSAVGDFQGRLRFDFTGKVSTE